MGLIRRSYTYLDKNSFHYLFNALVRSHLKFCVSVWYPLLKNEVLIENVLRGAINLIPRISNFSYADHICPIDIPSMKYCRIRGDMISVYQILHSEDQLLKALFNADNTSITRNH